MAIVPKLYDYICMNAHFAFAHTHYIYKENASLGRYQTRVLLIMYLPQWGVCYTCAEQKSRRFNAMSLLVGLQAWFGQDVLVA